MADSCTIVFDLDDTLYLERDFVRSGFRAADRWLQDTSGVNGLFEHCQKLFDAGVRKNIFDRALPALGLTGAPELVAQLVEVYRNHEPEITLTDDVVRYFGRRPPGLRFGLITDGPEATQMAKIRALNLDKVMQKIVCTGAWADGLGKPHPLAFETIERWCGCSGERLAYIGDNLKKDFVTPKARGWWTVQIIRSDRVHHVAAPDSAHLAHARIAAFDVLDKCLANLDRNWNRQSIGRTNGG